MTTSLQSIINPEYKEKIFAFLENFLQKKSEEFSFVNTFGQDVKERILGFISRGKMIRGSLIFFSYSLFSKKESAELIRASCAIELLHSSLLAHDDIMDQDFIRRGEQSIFSQYKTIAEENNFKDSLHFGESMGICFGDIGFFLAYELLSEISTKEIVKIFSKELSYVVLAQMQDMANAFSKRNVAEDDILRLYKYKTGRYTFSLPFIIGAMLANQDKEILEQLGKIGELLGMLFQLKDDELGLFGNEKETGKPVGSDIRENKKTLYRTLIFQNASEEQKRKIGRIFGNDHLSANDILYIHNLYTDLNIEQQIQEHIKSMRQNIEQQIQKLPIGKEKKKIFHNLIEYSIQRTK